MFIGANATLQYIKFLLEEIEEVKTVEIGSNSNLSVKDTPSINLIVMKNRKVQTLETPVIKDPKRLYMIDEMELWVLYSISSKISDRNTLLSRFEGLENQIRNTLENNRHLDIDYFKSEYDGFKELAPLECGYAIFKVRIDK